ncbi:hypothetical protein ACVI1J_008840 [Bradyrhizobium diazoefficiens]
MPHKKKAGTGPAFNLQVISKRYQYFAMTGPPQR